MKHIFNHKYISTQSVIAIISWLVLIMISAILCCLVYFLNTLDNLVETELRQRISLAHKVETMHQQKLLEEYTYWDETYKNVYLNLDDTWVAEYVIDALLWNTDFDFSVAISQDTQLVFLKTKEGAKKVDFNHLMNQGLAEMIGGSKGLETDTRVVSGFLQLNNSIYFIIGGPLISEMSDTPRAGTYMAIGVEIDKHFLEHLAHNYQLSGLKLTADIPVERTIFETVHSPKGEKIAVFSVTFRSPSKTSLPILSLIIFLFAFITVGVVALILRKEERRRVAYEGTLIDQASTDPLTKIYNRRYFFTEAENEFALHKLQQNPLSVVVLDIDHFKSINDTHGHSVGDKALVHFAEICRKCLRKPDLLGRIGGEEFAIVLSNTTTQEALTVANSLRVQVAECPFPCNGESIEMTVSVGLATLNEHEHFKTLLDHADEALYTAKNSGRNQVFVYGG